MTKPKRGRPPKLPEAGRERSHIALFLEKMVRTEGTQQKLVARIGGEISRPLVTRLLSGSATATTAAVAALCRACDPGQAAELIRAHLEDELARVLAAYRPMKEAMWDGSLGHDLAVKAPPPPPPPFQRTEWVAVDELEKQYFQGVPPEPETPPAVESPAPATTPIRPPAVNIKNIRCFEIKDLGQP